MPSTIRFQRGGAAGGSGLSLMSQTLMVQADTWDVSEEGVLRFGLIATGADADVAASELERVAKWLSDARLAVERGQDWVELYVRRGTSQEVLYDVVDGTLLPQGAKDRFNDGQIQLATLELSVLGAPRGLPYTLPPTTILTNGSARVLVKDVPGDLPALVRLDIRDESTSGVINRLMVFAAPSPVPVELADYEDWVDVDAISPATETADATAYGGDYATREISSVAAYADVARATMPPGALNKGRRSIWARVYDPAVAIGAPTGLSATDAGYAPRIRTASLAATLAIGNNSTVVSPSWAAATLPGTIKFCIFRDGTDDVPSMSAAWALLDRFYDATGNVNSTALFVCNDPAVRSGSESISTVAFADKAALLFEVENVAAEPLELLVRTDGAAVPYAASGPDWDPSNTLPTLMIVTHCNGATVSGAGTQATYGAPTDGFSEVRDDEGIQLAQKVITGGRAIASLPAVRTQSTGASTPWISFMLALAVQQTTENELPNGAYSVRVAAVDATGGIGAGCATVGATVAYNLGALSLAWTAPASGTVAYYRVTLQAPNGRFYLVTTPTNATTYTLRTLTGAKETTALDSTSAGTPSPNRLRAKLGVVGGTTLPVGDAVPVPLSNQWIEVMLGSDLHLPPQLAMIDAQRPEWQIDIDAISSSGVASAMRIDALWLPPSDGSFCVMEVPGLALGTKGRWYAETSRSGKSMIGWLRSLVDGTTVNRLLLIGALTLRPGDNILTLRADQAGLLSSLTASRLSLTLTVYPRYLWERGTP